MPTKNIYVQDLALYTMYLYFMYETCSVFHRGIIQSNSKCLEHPFFKQPCIDHEIFYSKRIVITEKSTFNRFPLILLEPFQPFWRATKLVSEFLSW